MAQARQGCSNAELGVNALSRVAPLGPAEHQVMQHAMDKLGMSMRAYHRILKVARTIADLNAETKLNSRHLLEAMTYRSLDRDTATSSSLPS
jgi:magnesium chelatase family protein